MICFQGYPWVRYNTHLSWSEDEMKNTFLRITHLLGLCAQLQLKKWAQVIGITEVLVKQFMEAVAAILQTSTPLK
jgi:hypothetical protein